MASVDGAIKELLRGELQDASQNYSQQQDLNKKLEDRLNELESRLTDIVPKVESQPQLLDGMEVRIKALEACDIEAFKALQRRVELAEDSPDSGFGLKQLWERLDVLKKEQDDTQPKIDQGNRSVQAMQTKNELVEVALGQIRQNCEDLSAKVLASQSLAGVPNKLSAHIKDLEDLSRRTKAMEEFETDSLKSLEKRLSFVEDDADGVGGVKQLWARIDATKRQLDDIQPSLEQCSKVVKDTKSRTDGFEDVVGTLRAKCDEWAESVADIDSRVREVEASNQQVSASQEELQSLVDQKYERLWGEVPKAIEEMEKRLQLQEASQAGASQRASATTGTREAKSLVNHALGLVASVQAERQQLRVGRDMFSEWKEQTWISARRRMGIYAFKNFVHRKQRDALSRWVRQTAIESLSARLKQEFSAQIPDFEQCLEASGLPARASDLERNLAQAQTDACSNMRFDAAITEQAARFQGQAEELSSVRSAITFQETRVSQNVSHNEEQDQIITALGSRLDVAQEERIDLAARIEERALAAETQTILRDVLLIWNSIKTLDASKADKKDVDLFAMESNTKEKLSEQRFEDVSVEIAGKVREETLRAQEKWADLDRRQDDSSRQLRHWEGMWDKLADSVEDLVQKVGAFQSTQQGTTLKPFQHHVNRPSSGPSSRPGSRGPRSTLPGRSVNAADAGLPLRQALVAGGHAAA